ncbi:hypothetical protein H4219_002989 [Mycoemilia scoparia]|uniref:Monopolin complex subunit Csm1/Pcs1 C-terminal domain-containing protein n=1 Tax=Mycoemilia scoparia TaxID=417184 RepID=A0A9W8DTA8_9FUNG|nr:hypothetical protein H4219_002989 [Mycoemilia scoparia]
MGRRATKAPSKTTGAALKKGRSKSQTALSTNISRTRASRSVELTDESEVDEIEDLSQTIANATTRSRSELSNSNESTRGRKRPATRRATSMALNESKLTDIISGDDSDGVAPPTTRTTRKRKAASRLTLPTKKVKSKPTTAAAPAANKSSRKQNKKTNHGSPPPVPDGEEEEVLSGDKEKEANESAVVVIERRDIDEDLSTDPRIQDNGTTSKTKSATGTSRTRQPTKKPSNALNNIDQAKYWQEKFETISKLRETEVEKEYQDYKKFAEKRFAAAEEKISQQLKKIQDLQDKLKSATQQKPEKPAEPDDRQLKINEQEETIRKLHEDVKEANETIRRFEEHRRESMSGIDYNLRDKLRLYEQVTSFEITSVEIEDDGTSYHCKQTGPNGVLRYTLTVFDDEPDQFQYTPNLENLADQPLSRVLPDYLRNALEFKRDFSNMFFWRVCDFLHLKEKS